MNLAVHRLGHARVFGAVSVLNATATGIGCSLGIDAMTEAEWAAGPSPPLGIDARLVQAVEAQMNRVPGWPTGLAPRIRAAFPPARGLKTSSSVAAALLQSAHEALGQPLPDGELEHAAVDACLAAGVTITGAYDDQVAVVRGGAHITDNARRLVLRSLSIRPWHVAVWVPDAALPKAALAGAAATTLASQLQDAVALAAAGDIPGAMTENGNVFTAFYQRLGLPVDRRPAQAALRHGALGAGLSGTGPAVAALFDAPTSLPEVPGGTWRWARAVEADA
ncbi:MAG: shikimate kinase [bacterium]